MIFYFGIDGMPQGFSLTLRDAPLGGSRGMCCPHLFTHRDREWNCDRKVALTGFYYLTQVSASGSSKSLLFITWICPAVLVVEF